MLSGAVLMLPVLLAGAGVEGVEPSSRGGVTVSLAAPAGPMTLGDSLTVVCTVTIPPGARAEDPAPRDEDPLLGWEKRFVREEKAPSGVLRRYGFLAYVCSPDSVRFGPFAVPWTDASGKTGVALSDSVVLPVSGFVKDAGAPPQPSRAPLGIASKGPPWWWFALPAALLAAAAAVWWILRRRRKTAPIQAAPQKPLDEIGEFEYIRSLRLREAGQVKELYAKVSTAMRGFMHRNLGFDALHSTTEEIKRSLAGVAGDPEVKQSIGGLFDEADMVKFAKFIPPDTLTSTVIDRAIEPVKRILDHIEAERERERHAEEERKSSGSAPAADIPAGASAGGGEG